MIIPNKAAMLQRLCKTCLKPRGAIYFTQTFETAGVLGQIMKIVKPMLRFLTTIDFGDVTFWPDFEATLKAAGCRVQRKDVIYKNMWRMHCMVIAVPN